MKIMILCGALALSAMGQPYNASLFLATPSSFDSVATTMKFADVNGDGYPDLCWAVPTQGQIYCALYTNGQFGAPSVWSTDFYSGPMQMCSGANLNGRGTCWMTTAWVDPSVWDTIQFVDVNRDGKADLCGRNQYAFVCHLSTGSSFGGDLRATYDFGDAADVRWRNDASYYDTIRVVDINHDGWPDVCGRNSEGIICDLQIPDPSGAGGYVFCNPDYNRFGGNCRVYGFDFGDNLGWNSSPSYWSTIQFADINHDGYLDVCGRHSQGIVCATYNATPVIIEQTSNSQTWSLVFDQVSLWTTQFNDNYGWNQQQYYSTIKLVDMNHDGYADVCGRGGAGFYCATSTGSAFAGGFSVVADNFSDTNGWNQPDHYNAFWFQDVNGDGMPDICGRGSQGILCQFQQSGPLAPFSKPSLLVNNFGDNFGWGNSFSYWGTVQMTLLTRPGWPDWAFCGHGVAGVWCTGFRATGALL